MNRTARDPSGLWSLWELIEKHVQLFSATSANLMILVARCRDHQLRLPQQAAWPANDKTVALARSILDELRRRLILSDMNGAMPQLERVAAIAGGAVNVRDFQNELENLQRRVLDDLAQEFYLHIDQQDVAFYMATEPFGPGVGVKFPKCAEDIAEAAKCLALQRSTACVFHLMRAMEAGVKSLGKKLKIKKIDVEIESWAKIVDHIDKAIEALPAQTAPHKKRKAKLATAAANLNAVRIAQRNEVMHPKQTYTRQEAFDIFNATRAFMQHLATLV